MLNMQKEPSLKVPFKKILVVVLQIGNEEECILI